MNHVYEVFSGNPRKPRDVIHIDARGTNATSSHICLERCVILLARQDAGRVAILCDVNHLVKGALEAARAGWIDRDRNQPGLYAPKKRADHLEPWRVSEQKPVSRREAAVFQQMPGNRFCSAQKRRVRVALGPIAIYVKKRVEKLGRVLIRQLFQVVYY